ncbi:Ankyrin repeat, PH and SEC7 domain containing protein secG [Dirofilaria immitis]
MSLIRALNESDMIATARILDLFPSEVFFRDDEDRVALHHAAETANAEIFKRILEMDHSLVHCQDQNGYTPLLIASMSGNVSAIKLMIENDIQINHVDKDKHSAVHWAVGAQAVHYAAASENVSLERCEAILHVLLKYGAKVNARDIDGRTPILWAASYGNLEIVIILSKTGGDIYAVDRDQLGAIHCAASHGHAHIIEYLINTLDPSIINLVDRNGDTALFYAVTLGHYECARLLLLNGAEVNHQDRHLRCPSHCAAAKGQLRMLKLLKHFGGSYEIQNRRGDLPIHEAIQAGAKDCVEYLLASHPSSANVANHEGRTGLHLAAASGNMEMVILLCGRNTDVNPLMLYKDTLLTPLDLAIQKNHEMVVEYLRLRQNAKLAEEIPEEIRKETRLQLQHQVLEVRNDKQKYSISPDGNRISIQSGKLAVPNAKNITKTENANQGTQTTIQIYRATATNTSRSQSSDDINIPKPYQSTVAVQQLVPKATSTADLEQYLPEIQLQKITEDSKNVYHKNEKIDEVNGDNCACNNCWTSEEDDVNVDDVNTKHGKSSSIQLNELKKNERSCGKSEKREKMKEKLMEVTRLDENWSDNDIDNGKQVNDNLESSSVYGMSDISHSGRSIIPINNSHKNYSHKASKSGNSDDFRKKLEKSIGSQQVDIYRTEFGEITMQQQFNKNKRIGKCCVHEEAIFNELTHLKKMQLQYSKVKEQILVRSLINNFCKMYNLNPAQFKFNTFHAWEKFLCDHLSEQLKLLYVEERNRILNSHHSHYSTINKYKASMQKQKFHDSTVLNTMTEDSRSAHSNSLNTVLCTGEKRCNCLYNKHDLL